MNDSLKDRVEAWAEELSEKIDSLEDYLETRLSLSYVVDESMNCFGGEILVASGGPNIVIDTRRDIVKGNWWGEYAEAPYTDTNDIEEWVFNKWREARGN